MQADLKYGMVDIMYDLITIGDITFDIFYKGEALTQDKERFNLAIGGKYHVDDFHTSVGGGGANVAVGAARHGLNTAVCGRIGDNVFKQILVQKLTIRKVSTEFLIYDSPYINLSTILLTQTGERTIVHYVKDTGRFFRNENAMAKIKNTKFIYVGNLPDVSITERETILRFFKKSNVPICLNLGSADCKLGLGKCQDLIGKAKILTLNTYEFSDLVGKQHEKLDFKKDCRKLLGKKPPEILILTDGEKGSYIYENDNTSHVKAIKIDKIVDTTGAGDAYISGFLSAFIRGKSPIESAETGAKYAARIVCQIGAQ